MRLTRVYVQHVPTTGTEFELPPEAATHVAKVLRARVSDELTLFCGDGREFRGTVESVRGAHVSVSIAAVGGVDRESPLQVTLLQCVPRGDRMDFIVQKATELGVTQIVPILSERSLVRLDAAQAESKAAHWRAVAVSACEQCGRNRIPGIAPVRALIGYLGQASMIPTRLVFLPDAAPCAAPVTLRDSAEIAIGPEGGFSDDELGALRLAGFVAVRLGPRILRAETAAIAALTWLQTRYGDLQPALTA